MDKRLRLLLRQASYNLRGGFLVRPSPSRFRWVSRRSATSCRTLFPSDSAFAILLMTLTLASMQFSPRIIVSTRDRVTQWTLAIFLGTFSYCMAALPAARQYRGGRARFSEPRP
jgi:Predicted membrane protein (DUF2254)